jgi:hypothetical protein
VLPGCAAEVLPPTDPARVQPKIAAPAVPPPADGKTGRIVIDSDSLPYEVREVTGQSRQEAQIELWHGEEESVASTPLCPAAPCVVDLPLGTHKFKVGNALVSGTVTTRPTVLRVSQPEVEKSPIGTWGGAAGVGVFAPFTVLGGVLTVAAANHSGVGDPSVPILAGSTVVLAALTAASGWLVYRSRDRVRPAGTVQFKLEEGSVR